MEWQIILLIVAFPQSWEEHILKYVRKQTRNSLGQNDYLAISTSDHRHSAHKCQKILMIYNISLKYWAEFGITNESLKMVVCNLWVSVERAFHTYLFLNK